MAGPAQDRRGPVLSDCQSPSRSRLYIKNNGHHINKDVLLLFLQIFLQMTQLGDGGEPWHSAAVFLKVESETDIDVPEKSKEDTTKTQDRKRMVSGRKKNRRLHPPEVVWNDVDAFHLSPLSVVPDSRTAERVCSPEIMGFVHWLGISRFERSVAESATATVSVPATKCALRDQSHIHWAFDACAGICIIETCRSSRRRRSWTLCVPSSSTLGWVERRAQLVDDLAVTFEPERADLNHLREHLRYYVLTS
ncbi:hypothetical protein C8R44DRAFT_727051 [Mycena epipterygia]|nr:hypothetical protein C8R44DRAFT_727051 [Mycena epipterygia]